MPFYHTIEDHYGVLSQYYELPWLSLRNAVWQGLVQDVPGFRAQDLFTAATDTKPPNPGAASRLEKQEHHLRHHQHSSSSRSTSSHGSNSSSSSSRHSTYLPSTLSHKYLADLVAGLLQQTFLEESLFPLSPSDLKAAARLPGPMFPGNWEGHGSGCSRGVDFRAAAMQQHRDWYFLAEGSPLHPQW